MEGGDSSSKSGGEGENFQDWELLPSSDSDIVVNPENSVDNSRKMDEIEGDYSGGMIRSDYFSLENENRYAKSSLLDASEEGSVESDNPSWIDPGLETRFQSNNSREFWSDTGSERSDEHKFGDLEGKNEIGLVENGKIHAGLVDLDARNELGLDEKLKGEVCSEGFGESQLQDKNLGSFWSDSGGKGLVLRSFEGVEKEEEMDFGYHVEEGVESEACGQSDGENDMNSGVVIKEVKTEVQAVGVEEKGRIAWWKVPFELLKYCVLKVNPVWSLSVAAAMLGVVMLGRRLYKMKRKSKGLQLKVTLDDKKVSQFMSRAARLNEAFSVVRRAPIARPALPASGVNPWPAMISLR
ncbi:uncharacterized protein LOC123203614 [Mangifera indica]|uniref:uncharacterized protein LOC123203614 n=1 Tax=Mangifera indica TaxID=29780 RepID=UPI001CFAB01B|nr:uncharacterized protein LOC123203614 [Mangifera indica]